MKEFAPTPHGVTTVIAAMLFGFGTTFIQAETPASRPVAETAKPVPMIFDTDVGNDVDDVLALAMIHSLEDMGVAKLLAVTITNDSIWSASLVDLLNTFYGRPDVPIGLVRDGVPPDGLTFTEPMARRRDNGRLRYPHDLTTDAVVPSSVRLLRKVLADYPRDGEIVLVVVGFSTNISRLLNSRPDEVSPLDGRALIARKVRLLSIMAGAYGSKSFAEYNIEKDIAAARNVFSQWPTPIVASGFEVGEAILYPAESIRKDFGYVEHHPVREAYELYLKMPYDRPCWDLTSVLYAAFPDAGCFGLSPAGWIRVDEKGITHFEPDAKGQHRYLTVNAQQVERVREKLVELVSKRPGRAKTRAEDHG